MTQAAILRHAIYVLFPADSSTVIFAHNTNAMRQRPATLVSADIAVSAFATIRDVRTCITHAVSIPAP